MADVDEVVVYRGRRGATGYLYIVAEASPVDTNDTVTLGDLASITHAECFRLDTGASITCTTATNVVTITQAALTDIPVLVVATGY